MVADATVVGFHVSSPSLDAETGSENPCPRFPASRADSTTWCPYFEPNKMLPNLGPWIPRQRLGLMRDEHKK